MTNIRSNANTDTPKLEDVDEDIRALMADIDASIGNLEQRLEESRRGAPSTTRSITETVARPAAAAPTVAPTASAAPQADSGFLAELAAEADELIGSHSSDQERRARALLLHESLERIFLFLNQLARHSNHIGPKVNRAYRLDTKTEFADLTWTGAFADYRKQDLSERALLAYTGFRVRLVAPRPLTVSRRWDQMKALRDEMHILNLHTLDNQEPIGSPTRENINVVLAPDFPMEMRFKGNYDSGRIHVLARNIEGFGVAAFDLDPQAVDQSLLDGLGRFLVFRTNQLPPALRRVQFVKEEEE